LNDSVLGIAANPGHRKGLLRQPDFDRAVGSPHQRDSSVGGAELT